MTNQHYNTKISNFLLFPINKTKIKYNYLLTKQNILISKIKTKMRTNVDVSPFKKDFLNYADKDGFIREGKIITKSKPIFSRYD